MDVHKFFLSSPTLWVARSYLALVHSFLTTSLLSHATPALRVILLLAAVNLLRHPQYP
jgi:hypothetical protein